MVRKIEVAKNARSARHGKKAGGMIRKECSECCRKNLYSRFAKWYLELDKKEVCHVTLGEFAHYVRKRKVLGIERCSKRM